MFNYIEINLLKTDIIWTLIQVEANNSDSFQNDLSRQLDESINLGSSTPQTQSNASNPFSTQQQNQATNQVNNYY